MQIESFYRNLKSLDSDLSEEFVLIIELGRVVPMTESWGCKGGGWGLGMFIAAETGGKKTSKELISNSKGLTTRKF